MRKFQVCQKKFKRDAQFGNQTRFFFLGIDEIRTTCVCVCVCVCVPTSLLPRRKRHNLDSETLPSLFKSHISKSRACPRRRCHIMHCWLRAQSIFRFPSNCKKKSFPMLLWSFSRDFWEKEIDCPSAKIMPIRTFKKHEMMLDTKARYLRHRLLSFRETNYKRGGERRNRINFGCEIREIKVRRKEESSSPRRNLLLFSRAPFFKKSCETWEMRGGRSLLLSGRHVC